MTQMIVRPPNLYLDNLGNPLEGTMFVGKSNLDPQQEENQLICRDGIGGAILAQPIIVQNGITKNTDGQTVVVVIEAQQYSVRYLNLNGRVIDELSSDKLIGDALSDGGGSGAGIPDRTLNNFTQALNENLDGVNFIYIKSQSTGWEGTEEGPTITEFYYYTGGTGPASTGDTENYTFFYDTNGNEFKKVTDPALSDLEARVTTNETDIAQNTSDIAQNTSGIAQNTDDIEVLKNLSGFIISGQTPIDNNSRIPFNSDSGQYVTVISCDLTDAQSFAVPEITEYPLHFSISIFLDSSIFFNLAITDQSKNILSGTKGIIKANQLSNDEFGGIGEGMRTVLPQGAVGASTTVIDINNGSYLLNVDGTAIVNLNNTSSIDLGIRSTNTLSSGTYEVLSSSSFFKVSFESGSFT